jgi:hypothetical protein
MTDGVPGKGAIQKQLVIVFLQRHTEKSLRVLRGLFGEEGSFPFHDVARSKK